jgi:hypothetical protein
VAGLAGLPEGQSAAHELWTTRLLARRAREHAAVAGYPCLAIIAQGTVCKILTRNDVKPHQVRYYLERRDAALETKIAEVLCVYREVAVLRASKSVASDVAIIWYDEKPGIQAIANLRARSSERRCWISSSGTKLAWISPQATRSELHVASFTSVAPLPLPATLSVNTFKAVGVLAIFPCSRTSPRKPASAHATAMVPYARQGRHR